MPRLRNAGTGVVVVVDDDTAARLGPGWEPIAEPKAEGYAAMKVADLTAEIKRRNEGREETDLLPTEGKKADLIAVLDADDAARAEQ